MLFLSFLCEWAFTCRAPGSTTVIKPFPVSPVGEDLHPAGMPLWPPHHQSMLVLPTKTQLQLLRGKQCLKRQKYKHHSFTFVSGLSDAVSSWPGVSSWSGGDTVAWPWAWASSRPCSSSGGSSGGSVSSAYDTCFWVFRKISSCSRSRNWMWKTPSCSASHFPWVVFPEPLTPSMKTRNAGGWWHTNGFVLYVHYLYIFVIFYLFSQM